MGDPHNYYSDNNGYSIPHYEIKPKEEMNPKPSSKPKPKPKPTPKPKPKTGYNEDGQTDEAIEKSIIDTACDEIFGSDDD